MDSMSESREGQEPALETAYLDWLQIILSLAGGTYVAPSLSLSLRSSLCRLLHPHRQLIDAKDQALGLCIFSGVQALTCRTTAAIQVMPLRSCH